MDHASKAGHLVERFDDGGREAVAVILGGLATMVGIAVVASVVMLVRSLLS